MQNKLVQAHGNWVEGDRFWDRESDTALMIKRLDEGAHILLVAQRRMGKTSLMKEIKRQLNLRYTCLYVDLQKATTAEDAIVEKALHSDLIQLSGARRKDCFQMRSP
jgi:ornithine cyclodeaminase/alanine dehydrogenase-like protein (mu-crystallin family)